MASHYRHTQVGRATVAALGIALAAVVWWSARAGEPAPLITAVLLGVVLLIFSTLTVTVRDGALDVRFGPGLIRRRIPLHRIREVRVVTTPWYYGWGIRLTPTGWLWNVSGTDGVEVEFDNGRRFRVGSDEADKLADALHREMQITGRPAQ